jgi:hypothetical protein
VWILIVLWRTRGLYFKDESHSWGADGRWSTQEFPYPLWHPRVHYRFLKSHPLGVSCGFSPHPPPMSTSRNSTLLLLLYHLHWDSTRAAVVGYNLKMGGGRLSWNTGNHLPGYTTSHLLRYSENGGSKLVKNIGNHLPNQRASHIRAYLEDENSVFR